MKRTTLAISGLAGCMSLAIAVPARPQAPEATAQAPEGATATAPASGEERPAVPDEPAAEPAAEEVGGEKASEGTSGSEQGSPPPPPAPAEPAGEASSVEETHADSVSAVNGDPAAIGAPGGDSVADDGLAGDSAAVGSSPAPKPGPARPALVIPLRHIRSTTSPFGLPGLFFGGEAGVVGCIGDLDDELAAGLALRLHARAAVTRERLLAVEFDIGFSRQGWTALSGASLLRIPITVNLLISPPLKDLVAELGEGVPVPYLRFGGGLGIAMSRGLPQSTPDASDKASTDGIFQWGLGFEYELGRHFGDDRLSARLDFRHSLQFENLVGQFLVVTLGASYAFPQDSDGDGILDGDDQCPDQPEDPDAFEDTDGCPDPDNDRDGVLDDEDACPDRPEDFDDFLDVDGCPDEDNDRDGVLDAADSCPNEPEDLDAFDDWDGCPEADNDKDGIPDRRDKCPDEAEDVDGYQDGDGCPDVDNDGDGFLDADDQCPLKPEDINGVNDDDGCPDATDDADGDGLLDAVDKCPTEPEDLDHFEDDDGCPDLDNDQDGVLDLTDGCPLIPEDIDGFQDDDGCPEIDNDGDGIGDASDKCPNEAEIINGVDDADGCPDKGAQLVALTAERIEIRERVHFKTGSHIIQKRSFNLLNQVASVIKNHSLPLVRVEGHTDSRGTDGDNLRLSNRRAASVKRYLIKQGVAEERLQAQGHGESRPIASNKSRRGRRANRRVEFSIIKEAEKADAEPEGEGAGPSSDVPQPPPALPAGPGGGQGSGEVQDQGPEAGTGLAGSGAGEGSESAAGGQVDEGSTGQRQQVGNEASNTGKP